MITITANASGGTIEIKWLHFSAEIHGCIIFSLEVNGITAPTAVPKITINLFETLAHFIISFAATADKNAITIIKSGVYICQTTTARSAKSTTAVITLCFIKLTSESAVSVFKIRKSLVKILYRKIRPHNITVPKLTVSRLPKQEI